jgi:uncharacterized membrane protein YphA (DoxX/SURF4 family)
MEATASPDARGRHHLQRLFSAFPGGWPGIGLLLLRAAAGSAAIAEATAYVGDRLQLTPAALVFGVVAGVAGVLLVLGVLTPVTGAVVGVSMMCVAFSWVQVPAQHPVDNAVAAVLVVVVAVASALVGPGAVSLDSRFFGRREIIFEADRRK